MKKILLLLVICAPGKKCLSQKIDSLYFHLYTDSLKKGTHNYINVDGKLSNGKWKPLSAKEVIFSSDYGLFEGNELKLPFECKVEKVTIKAVLKSEPWIWKEITIWIKIKPDEEILPTKEDILNKPTSKQKAKNKTR